MMNFGAQSAFSAAVLFGGGERERAPVYSRVMSSSLLRCSFVVHSPYSNIMC